MSDFTDTVVSKPAAASAGDRDIRASRQVIEETIEENDVSSVPTSAKLDEATLDFGERKLPDSVKEKIAAMVKKNAASDEAGDVATDEPGTAKETAPAAETKPADAAVATTATTAETKPTDPPKEEKPADATPDPTVEYKATIDRLETTNKKLLADLETERKRPKPGQERKGPDYLEDSTSWLRQRIADELGIEDLKAKEVDEELAGIYADLTAKELGVTPNEAQQAKRDAARTRQLLAREKRERKAGEQSDADKVKAEAEAKKADDAATFIGNRLQTKRDDGRLFADEYPLLIELSEVVHGQKPERLLWSVIESGIQTGRLDPAAGDDVLIEAAAKHLETRFQALAAKATQASSKKTTNTSQTSTAQPSDAKSPAAPVSESKDQRQSHGARTLTNADASVAPATPPAKKPETKTNERPKFKTKREQQDWALRHLPK